MATPKGFSTVNSYIIVNEPDRYISFLKNAFSAEEVGRTMHEGRLANARIQIGESTVMISESSERFPPTNSWFYLYVDKVDEFFETAKANGAEVLMEPTDMPYGDRQAMISDPAGNMWFPSTRFDDNQFNS